MVNKSCEGIRKTGIKGPDGTRKSLSNRGMPDRPCEGALDTILARVCDPLRRIKFASGKEATQICILIFMIFSEAKFAFGKEQPGLFNSAALEEEEELEEFMFIRNHERVRHESRAYKEDVQAHAHVL